MKYKYERLHLICVCLFKFNYINLHWIFTQKHSFTLLHSNCTIFGSARIRWAFNCLFCVHSYGCYVIFLNKLFDTIPKICVHNKPIRMFYCNLSLLFLSSNFFMLIHEQNISLTFILNTDKQCIIDNQIVYIRVVKYSINSWILKQKHSDCAVIVKI